MENKNSDEIESSTGVKKRVVIIGGGASGFFTAINVKEMNPDLDVTILEKGREILQKVKISGGGRCNVTNACFIPKELVEYYPRGKKELLGPFHQFMTGGTFEWFEKRGVPLKIEADNRVFPEANTSQAIIDCFQKTVDKLSIKVLKNHGVNTVYKENKTWVVNTKTATFKSDYLVMAAGSSKKIWDLCKALQHNVVVPVPSLFTFNIKDSRLTDLMGVSVSNVSVKILDTKLSSSGPLLITHWGVSGPAILKLSAYGARVLAEKNYKYKVAINWINEEKQEVLQKLQSLKRQQPKKVIILKSPFLEISKRLWEKLVLFSKINEKQNWADLSNKQLYELANQLTNGVFQADGRTTFKEEFVTAGGVDLKEINFKYFESKLHKNLFFVGEILNIDAVTGGFNFQNAWTGGYICAKTIANL